MVWDHSLEELQLFISELNKFHPNIKFTHSTSQESVSFLDVTISKGDSLNVQTDLSIKETNNHQYLDCSSCHPKACKNGIPFSQAKRYRRIISNDESFQQSISQLRQFFIDRGYPNDILDNAFQKLLCSSQEEALQTTLKDKDSVIPFTIVYDPSLPHIGYTFNKYWDILNLSKNGTTKSIHKNYKPVVAYKRPKNLQYYLINSDYNKQTNKIHFSQSCNSKRFSHCVNIKTSSEFTSHVTGKTYSLHHDVNCKSKQVIYLITCKRCNSQYVGQTKQPVSKRMNSHRFDINNFSDPAFSSMVAGHFNLQDHCLKDFSFMPVDVVKNDIDRLCKETVWIHKLKTHNPSGLNSKLLFEVN